MFRQETDSIQRNAAYLLVVEDNNTGVYEHLGLSTSIENLKNTAYEFWIDVGGIGPLLWVEGDDGELTADIDGEYMYRIYFSIYSTEEVY